jgi:hypothetical protein
MVQLSDHGKVRNQTSAWVSRLDTGTLQLIGSKLDHPYVPGVLHLNSVCRSWCEAASQTPGLNITWRSSPCKSGPEKQHRRQLIEDSFQPWLSGWASQLHTFQMQSIDSEDFDAELVYQAVQQLLLPLKSMAIQRSPPAALVAALPHLRRLSLPLGVWRLCKNTPPGRPRLLAALGGLPHLTSLEVGLVQMDAYGTPYHGRAYWEEVLEAAPKQLQHLAFRLNWGAGHGRSLTCAYTWEQLAALPQLQQLQLDAMRVTDLAPLAALPSLTSLGLQWEGGDLEPLVAVKGVLRELEVHYMGPEKVPHLEQLSCLTSLRLYNSNALSSLPEQVATRLQHLDWEVWGHINSTHGSWACKPEDTQRLDHCSSSNLRQLRLRGWAWLQDRGAAAAVQRLTALTTLELRTMGRPDVSASTHMLIRRHMSRDGPLGDMAPWRELLPMRHLKQLRRLMLPGPLLATDVAWLGGLPHLTSLRLTEVEWQAPWCVEEVFEEGAVAAQVLSNLRSCWAGLKVLEVELTLSYSQQLHSPEVAAGAVAAVRVYLQQQLPGVHLLLPWQERRAYTGVDDDGEGFETEEGEEEWEEEEGEGEEEEEDGQE